jgi:hypothetical protein
MDSKVPTPSWTFLKTLSISFCSFRAAMMMGYVGSFATGIRTLVDGYGMITRLEARLLC